MEWKYNELDPPIEEAIQFQGMRPSLVIVFDWNSKNVALRNSQNTTGSDREDVGVFRFSTCKLL